MITTLREESGIHIAKLADHSRFTLAISENVKNELKPILNNSGTKLVLDLGNIDFIDSSGIGCVISLVKAAKSNGSVIKLCNLKPDVEKTLNLLNLHQVLDIELNVEACLNSL